VFLKILYLRDMGSLYPSILGDCHTLCDNGKEGGKEEGGESVLGCCSLVGSAMIGIYLAHLCCRKKAAPTSLLRQLFRAKAKPLLD